MSKVDFYGAAIDAAASAFVKLRSNGSQYCITHCVRHDSSVTIQPKPKIRNKVLDINFTLNKFQQKYLRDILNNRTSTNSTTVLQRAKV